MSEDIYHEDEDGVDNVTPRWLLVFAAEFVNEQVLKKWKGLW